MQLKLKADGCLGKLFIQLTTEELFVIVAQSDLMNVIVVWHVIQDSSAYVLLQSRPKAIHLTW